MNRMGLTGDVTFSVKVLLSVPKLPNIVLKTALPFHEGDVLDVCFLELCLQLCL